MSVSPGLGCCPVSSANLRSLRRDVDVDVAGGPELLGSTAPFASPPPTKGGSDRGEAVAMRYALQSEARRLLPWHRVAVCLRARVAGAEAVEVWHRPATEGVPASAGFGALQTCGSPWVCPVCSAKIAAERRDELARGVEAWRKEGGRVFLVTFTTSHHARMSVASLLPSFLAACRQMKRGAPWQRFKQRQGLVGSVRGLEVTHSFRNGWHVHCHALYFVPAGTDVTTFRAALFPLWERAAAAEGLAMDKVHGLDVLAATGVIEEYVTKYGREPERVPGGWGPEAELAKPHAKRARWVADDPAAPGRTPFELLAASLAGDRVAGALVRDFARAFHGCSQLQWSPGLRKALGLPPRDQPDAEVADTQDVASVLLGRLTPAEWRDILLVEGRAVVVRAALGGDWETVQYAVACLRLWATYWRIMGYVSARTRLREFEDYTPAEIARWRLQRRARAAPS